MNYAVAEHHIGGGKSVANLMPREVEYKGITIPACPHDIQVRIKDALTPDNGKILLKSDGVKILTDFNERTWNEVILVDKDLYSHVNTLRKHNKFFIRLFSRIACDDCKDSLGNFI